MFSLIIYAICRLNVFMMCNGCELKCIFLNFPAVENPEVWENTIPMFHLTHYPAHSEFVVVVLMFYSVFSIGSGL